MHHLARIALTLLSATSPAAAQGPPPGAGSQPIDDLPIVIERPGSYYLTRSVVWSDGGTPIQIAADQVSVNLNGFALTGSAAAFTAIRVRRGHKDISIANGCIFGFAGHAINAQLIDGGVLQGLVLAGNGTGILCGARFVISDCILRDNQTNGLNAGAECTIKTCVARGSLGAGFLVGPNTVVTDSTASRNGIGFEALIGRATFQGCAASENTTGGFKLSNRSFMTQCLVDSNGSFGVEAAFTCTIHDNSIQQNSIRVTASNCSIQGNHLSAGSISVLGTKCTVVRNSVAGGTYSIPAGNLVGPLVDASQVATNTNPHANYQL